MNSFLLLFLLSSCNALSNTSNESKGYEGRIVGGKSTTIENHPYQLALELFESYVCGASLIGTKWALTAAHCINGWEAKYIRIRAGTSLRGTMGVIIPVKKIHQHPLFNKHIKWDYDIAVIELSLEVDPKIAIPIALQKTELKGGELGNVTGWGLLQEEGNLAKDLQVITVPVLEQTECKKIFQEALTDRMICVGDLSGNKDACNGDSGGPFVYDNKLVGIVSWGHGCASENYPGIYTSIPKLAGWVEQITSAGFSFHWYCRVYLLMGLFGIKLLL